MLEGLLFLLQVPGGLAQEAREPISLPTAGSVEDQSTQRSSLASSEPADTAAASSDHAAQQMATDSQQLLSPVMTTHEDAVQTRSLPADKDGPTVHMSGKMHSTGAPAVKPLKLAKSGAMRAMLGRKAKPATATTPAAFAGATRVATGQVIRFLKKSIIIAEKGILAHT